METGDPQIGRLTDVVTSELGDGVDHVLEAMMSLLKRALGIGLGAVLGPLFDSDADTDTPDDAGRIYAEESGSERGGGADSDDGGNGTIGPGGNIATGNP